MMVLSFITLVGLPWLAFRGIGFRGLYLAVGLSALLIGVLTVLTTGTAPTSIHSPDPATQAGAEFLTVYGFSFARWAFLTGFGAMLGVCLYRRSR